MTQHYYSHGKLLLTGEYLVLHGAVALALPLNLGQSMEVESLDSRNNRLIWEAFDPQGLWLTAVIDKNTLQIISCNDEPKASKLCEILCCVRQLNPTVFPDNDLRIKTRLDFHPEWGLGSSSTLIANLSEWAKTNPYKLLRMTFGGSGYDIACATATTPIFYQLTANDHPVTAQAPLAPPFAEKLYFVYQGKKQISAKEVLAFENRISHADLRKEIEAVNAISRALPNCQQVEDFCSLLNKHEAILSYCLERPALQKRFPEFEGCIKSLGAWGGDFFLAATKWDESSVKEYFKSEGLEVVLRYQDVVKTE